MLHGLGIINSVHVQCAVCFFCKLVPELKFKDLGSGLGKKKIKMYGSVQRMN